MTKIDLLTQQLELLTECQSKLAQAKLCLERALGKERYLSDEISEVIHSVGDRIDILQMDIAEEINK